jgi:hypothetical protein
VFNVGEWVEGYTNFLWTCGLGLAARPGLDIPLTALAANAACYALLVWVTAEAVRRAVPPPPAIPVSAIAVGLAPAVVTYGSSGLETVPAALLVVSGMALAASRRRLLAAGFALVLAALTRPDHLLFWSCLGLALAAEDLALGRGPWLRRLRVWDYTRLALPLVLVYVPYFLWRRYAYGDLFPNTYYARSAGEPYYEQGWIYLLLFLGATGLPILLLGAASIVAWRRPRSPTELRYRLFVGLALVVYGAYVVRVGGDFMEYRFLLVLLPLVAVATEVGLRTWLAPGTAPPPARPARIVALALVGLGFAMLPCGVDLFEPGEKRWHVSAEHTFYPVRKLSPLRVGSKYFRTGKGLEEVFADLGPRPKVATDCVGFVGYYSDLPIVDLYGLTNRRIGHKPITTRGRPGHEKRGSLEDALAEGATLTLDRSLVRGRRAYRLLPGLTVYALRHDPELDAALRSRPGVRPPRSSTPRPAMP